ncbi:MAG: GAF domain-containing protein [Acidobacteriota bacterium]|nr:GAF domain-containing protein [Acidobacteriota bacterium]
MSHKRTKQSRLERISVALRAYSKVSRALLHSSSEQELLQSIVGILNDAGDYGLVWIGVAEDNPQHSVRIVAAAGQERDYLASLPLSWGRNPLGFGPVGRCLRGEGICVSSDFLGDPSCMPWREMARLYDLRAIACLPLVFDSASHAVLTVYRKQEMGFAQQEINLLSELAEDVSLGVQAMRTRQLAEANLVARQQLDDQQSRNNKTEAVGQLSRAIAHEFNNLLTIISGQTELLSMDLNGKQLDRAQKVRNSVRRAADLTRHLSTFSQHEQLPPAETTLHALLNKVTPEVERMMRNGVHFASQCCESPWNVRISAPAVEQLIKLIASSAVDAMPAGGQLTIAIANCTLPGDPELPEGCVPPGRYAMLSVSDTGNGAYPGIRSRLMEPAFRTTPLERGMGLTLTLIHELAQENGGIVCVRSTPETGTCFRVYFAAAAQDALADEARAEQLSRMKQSLQDLPASSTSIN